MEIFWPRYFRCMGKVLNGVKSNGKLVWVKVLEPALDIPVENILHEVLMTVNWRSNATASGLLPHMTVLTV